MEAYERKREALDSRLLELGELAVAFSGGVDSSVLLHAGYAALGERCVGLVADSPSLPRVELLEARRVAESIGVRLIELRTDELSDPRYSMNVGDRCYWCKQALFEGMREWAVREGFSVLSFGEITDDATDDRPGARAASELGVTAPLRDAGFTKDDVRRYAREAGLSVADKPASACLSSRVPIGTEVTASRLARIEEAEERLRARGFSVLRVRHHGSLARVEVGEDEVARARALAGEIHGDLRACGFEEWELAVYRAPAAEETTKDAKDA
jgi:pyridinium-3,5-biscarboxylic acid mononucleotide sulfurtransferase